MGDARWNFQTLSSDHDCCSIAAQFNPDLVVVDWLLASGINGLQIARQLRSARPELPIVLVTGFVFDDEEMTPLTGLIDAILRKPFRAMQFIDTIREVLAFRSPVDPAGMLPARRA